MQKPSKSAVICDVVADPSWWLREVVTALIIGGLVAAGTIVGQKLIDDRRSDRELAIAADANRHREQLEDLRFVRDRSWDTPDDARRFAEFDLAGQNLVGLHLTGSDFARADFTDANLAESDLSRSIFARAKLCNTDLAQTKLRQAYFGVDRIIDVSDHLGADLTGANLADADLTDADLSQAILTGANLTRANLTNVYYDQSTRWPVGFVPPPSRPTH